MMHDALQGYEMPQARVSGGMTKRRGRRSLDVRRREGGNPRATMEGEGEPASRRGRQWRRAGFARTAGTARWRDNLGFLSGGQISCSPFSVGCPEGPTRAAELAANHHALNCSRRANTVSWRWPP